MLDFAGGKRKDALAADGCRLHCRIACRAP